MDNTNDSPGQRGDVPADGTAGAVAAQGPGAEGGVAAAAPPPTAPPLPSGSGSGGGSGSSSGGGSASPSAAKPARRMWPGFAIFGWFAKLLAAGLAWPLDLALLGLFGVAIVLNVVAQDLPEVDVLNEVQFEEPLRVYTSTGALIAEFGVQRRRAVAYKEVPPQLIDAFIATEDSRFFDHPGIDLIGIGRALLDVARTGSPSQGGSTITMQVARNFFLTPEKTVKRKLAEMLLALKMETTLSKEEILSLYLNKIFFGHRAYGISAAAEFYYSKSLDELTLAEMAVLAGLPKAPSANNPLMNPERARERRDYILDRMLELGYITEGEHAMAWVTPLTATAYVPPIEFNAGYIAEMARQAMVDRYGEAGAYSMGLKVYTTIQEPLQAEADAALREGLWAYTLRHGYTGAEAQVEGAASMTPEQLDEYLSTRPVVHGMPVGVVTKASASSAEVYLGAGKTETLKPSDVSWARRFKNENWRGPRPSRVSDAVAVGDVIRLRQNDKGNWTLAQVPMVGGALVALSPWDGAIRALSGGYSFEWSKFNRVTDAKRQPGSTFKPFIYSAAFGKGYTPASLVRDDQSAVPKGNWKPKNADGRYMGPIRIRVALTKSRNLATIDMIRRMGVDHARTFIQNFGFPLDSMPPDWAMALGSGSVTPLELARGFAVFANGGYLVDPYFITRVEDVHGNLLFEAEPRRACRECWIEPPKKAAAVTQAEGAADDPKAPQTVDPRIAYSIDSILKDVITQGTAKRALVLKRKDIAGKTGTTNDARDSWFAGYQPDLVTIAWMGRDDNKPLGHGEWGGTAALGIWVDFMKDALKDIPVAEVRRPERMVPVRVGAASGTATKGKGGVVEYVAEEYQLMTLGPDPIQYTGPAEGGKTAKAKAKPKPKRTAPRVLDELF